MNKKARCPWAVKFGVTLHTRCKKDVGHENDPNDATHVGRGLREYPTQEIRWLDGDKRQFLTQRDDIHSWDEVDGLTDAALREFMERGPEV